MFDDKPMNCIFVGGWNMPQYDPTCEAVEFDSWREARRYIADEMSRHIGEQGCFGNEGVIEVSELAVDECRNGEGLYEGRFGDFIYWVRCCNPRIETAS